MEILGMVQGGGDERGDMSGGIMRSLDAVRTLELTQRFTFFYTGIIKTTWLPEMWYVSQRYRLAYIHKNADMQKKKLFFILILIKNSFFYINIY